MFVILSHNGKFDDMTIKTIMLSVIISGLCQSFLSLIDLGQSGYRTAIYFNNPNQLGYWALLSASIVLVCVRKTQAQFLFQVLVFIVFLYLVSLSLSKAAILSFLMLVAIHCSRNLWHILIATIVGAVLIILVSDWLLFLDIVDRLQTVGQDSDDSAVGRGYNRLWLYPQYIILGAGEGGFQRFSNVSIELHSTFGTVLFSYGVIGAILFGLILWRLYRLADLWVFAYLIPVLVYGATHQGLRFSFIWVLFSVIAVCGTKRGLNKTKGKRLLRLRTRFSRPARTTPHPSA